MKKLLLALSAVLFSLSSCTDDGDDDGADAGLNPVAQRRAIIGIEGTSPNGISSVAEYDINNQSVENNLYRKANINPMGAQLNDMMVDAEAGIVSFVLPGSDKVVFSNISRKPVLC